MAPFDAHQDHLLLRFQSSNVHHDVSYSLRLLIASKCVYFFCFFMNFSFSINSLNFYFHAFSIPMNKILSFFDMYTAVTFALYFLFFSFTEDISRRSHFSTLHFGLLLSIPFRKAINLHVAIFCGAWATRFSYMQKRRNKKKGV